MNKICVIGHFGFGKNLLNGQTIKTKIITKVLKTRFGNDSIQCLDLAGGIKRIPSLLIEIPRVLFICENIVIMPVENGLMFLTPVLNFWNFFLKKKIHYVVIGGWLHKFISTKKYLMRGIKKFYGIYVETNSMKVAMEKIKFQNIFVLPNCKYLNILSKEELVYSKDIPYRLCTFSRVMKEKGIETAINAIKEVNNKLGYIAYSLDIYGQVWNESKEWFKQLQEEFPTYVTYMGCVDADKSVDVLKNYFALIFPTQFYTEGIPGTIIDAYAAGIPVISAKWESFSDVIEEGITGVGYEFNNEESLINILIQIANNPQIFLEMKLNCIRKAKQYLPEYVIKVLVQEIDGRK